MTVSGVFPSAVQWRWFLDQLLLWLGTLLAAAGVVCFFAYNWNDLGRFAKFAIVEALIAGGLIVVWRIGLERISGKAALFAVSLFVGVLLALIGQTYQTGADTFELFGVWAAFILPWVLAGRFGALWLFWLALINLAAILYFQTFGGLFGFLFSTRALLWALFGFNTLALAIWEVIAARGRREEWFIRPLATASGGLVTALAVYAIVDTDRGSAMALLAWFAWLGAAYLVYRRMLLDVFVLAGGVLSVIIVVTAALGRWMLDSRVEAGGLLFIGMVVIGLSAAGGWWLKLVVNEAKP